MTLYERERQDAIKASDDKRVDQVDRATRFLASIETYSELLLNLRVNAPTLFQPVHRVEALGAFLKANCSKQDLYANAIFVDGFPTNQLMEDSDCLLINSRPTLREWVCSQQLHVTLLGQWLVDVYQAHVEALEGAHINLRDTVSTARCLADNASAIRRQDTYYQGVLDLYGVCFRELELLSRKMDPQAVLEYVIQDGEDPSMPISLYDTNATTSIEKGDQLFAENERFVLVRNAVDRSYKLFQKRSEQELVDYMRSTTKVLPLNEDLLDLEACLVRDYFLRLPGEQVEIGRNYLGEPVTLSFDTRLYSFVPHNLYVQTVGGDWRAEETTIDLVDVLPLNGMIERIKERYSQALQGAPEQKVNHSVRR